MILHFLKSLRRSDYWGQRHEAKNDLELLQVEIEENKKDMEDEVMINDFARMLTTPLAFFILSIIFPVVGTLIWIFHYLKNRP